MSDSVVLPNHTVSVKEPKKNGLVLASKDDLGDKISNKVSKISNSNGMKLEDLDFSSDEEEPKGKSSNSQSKGKGKLENQIDITVIDPMEKGKTQTFQCEKTLLLEKMKFFDLYNKEA